MNAAYFACRTIYFIWAETILCQSPRVPTRALTAWPPRLCNHRNSGSKEHPRPHGQGTQLPHHSFQVLQDSVQVQPKLCFSNANAPTRRNCFCGDWWYDLTALFSSSSCWKGWKPRLGTIHNDRHCKKELCLHPFESFTMLTGSLSWWQNWVHSSWNCVTWLWNTSNHRPYQDPDYFVYWSGAWSWALCGSTQLRRKWLQLILLSFVRPLPLLTLVWNDISGEETPSGMASPAKPFLFPQFRHYLEQKVSPHRLSNCVYPIQTHVCAINSWLSNTLQSNCRSGGTSLR